MVLSMLLFCFKRTHIIVNVLPAIKKMFNSPFLYSTYGAEFAHCFFSTNTAPATVNIIKTKIKTPNNIQRFSFNLSII